MFAFALIFLWRYIRFVRHMQLWVQRRAIPLPEKPKYKPSDATILIPTICDHRTATLAATLRRCAMSRPHQIILIGAHNRQFLDPLVARYEGDFRLHGCGLKALYGEEANKRKQVALGVKEVRTDITVLVDDDVIWPENLLTYVLAAFENPDVGGAGTLQKVQLREGLSLSEKIFEFVGSFYIQRRNVEINATINIDGGTSCLSGRTAAVLSEIIQDPEFLRGYTGEAWHGKILKADDDNFITRWLFKKRKEIRIQTAPEAVIKTYLEVSPKFLKQCLRWVRSTWRSNWTTLRYDSDVWMKQPWSTYALYTQVPFASIIVDPLLIWLLLGASRGLETSMRSYIISAFFVWLAYTKIAKFIPLYYENPKWLFFLPINLLFGYFHAFIRFHALFTLSKTGWASRSLKPPPARPSVPRRLTDGMRSLSSSALAALGISNNGLPESQGNENGL